MSYTYIDIIEKVLNENGQPLTIRQIWDYTCKMGYNRELVSVEKKQIKQYTHVYSKIKKGAAGKFAKVNDKPAFFALKKSGNRRNS